jgi:shikimate dehydrogenase
LRILGIEQPELARLTVDLSSRTALGVQAALLGEKTLERGMAEAEVVIQATPVGMAPRVDESIVPARLLRRGQVVFDVVYTPLETKLLRDAAAAGARAVPGLGMFVHQAAIQFELWTGKPAPVDVMTRTVTDALADRP